MVYNVSKISDADHEKKPVVVVLGVHRSGTSLSARVLNGLGIRFGDKLIPGRSDNPAGFFEHRGVLEQTKSLDYKLGVAPFQNGGIVPCKESWWDDPDIAGEKSALKKILEQELELGDGVFGFKDPRSLYYLPMWQGIFSELNLMPRYVLALRNVNDVILSMMKRGTSQPKAEIIWMSHLASGLCCISQGIDSVVHFENWFNDAEFQAERLITELKVFDVKKQVDIKTVLNDVVKSDLRHHRTLKTNRDAFLSPIVENFYSMICKYAQGEVLWDTVRTKAEAFCESLNLYEPWGRGLERQFVEYKNELSSTKKELSSAKKELSSAKNELSYLKTLDGQLKFWLKKVNKDRFNSQKDNAIQKKSDRNFSKLVGLKAPGKYVARILNICFVAENIDIDGSVNSVSESSTYVQLAFILAKAGHKVTFFYLNRGCCEKAVVDDLVKLFTNKGIAFVTVNDVRNSKHQLYKYLKKNQFDLVHLSTLHGTGYLCLLAKKQGLGFENTVFCIKPLLSGQRRFGTAKKNSDKTYDSSGIYSEQRSVELADILISSSKDILRWMLDKGYVMPEHYFFQPDVIYIPSLSESLKDIRSENKANVGQWLNFHSQLSKIIAYETWLSEKKYTLDELPLTSVCLIIKNNFQYIKKLYADLEKAKNNVQICVICEENSDKEYLNWFHQEQKKSLNLKNGVKTSFVIRSFKDPCSAKNYIASGAEGDFLIFMDDNTFIKNEAIETLAEVAVKRNADVLLPACEYSSLSDNNLALPPGDPCLSFSDTIDTCPLIYVKKKTFEELGGFKKISSSTIDLAERAVSAGKFVEIVPEPLIVI